MSKTESRTPHPRRFLSLVILASIALTLRRGYKSKHRVTDPLIAGLPGDNGGPTPTLLPSSKSPILQAGTDCETVDQRGETRDTAACDLCAVELP